MKRRVLCFVGEQFAASTSSSACRASARHQSASARESAAHLGAARPAAARTAAQQPPQHGAWRASNWLDPRRPVSVNRGTLALLLLGGVAGGAAFDRHWPLDEWESELQGVAGGLVKPFSKALAHASQLKPPLLPDPPPASTPMPLSGCLSPYFIADAAIKAAPAVVNILVNAQQSGGLPIGSSGSGFIIDAEGTVVTNAHVVADAIQQQRSYGAAAKVAPGHPRPITVTLHDGRAFEASLLNYDAVSDLALLKIDADTALPAVRLGSSAALRAGEWVVALGSPLHLQNSVTAGIVSCIDRKAVELGLAEARTAYIQTDASIARGSSGGPLVNLSGEVVGVSCMKALAADGVSFAIPIDVAREVVAQLREHGRVIRPYIGVKLLQLNQYNAAQFRCRDASFPDVSGGILVPFVTPGSPAESAGLRPGDVIIGFAGDVRVPTTSGLVRALSVHIGREMELRVRRPSGRGEAVLKVVAQEAGGCCHPP